MANLDNLDATYVDRAGIPVVEPFDIHKEAEDLVMFVIAHGFTTISFNEARRVLEKAAAHGAN